MTSFGIKRKIRKFWTFLVHDVAGHCGAKIELCCFMDLLEKVEPKLFANEDKILPINRT